MTLSCRLLLTLLYISQSKKKTGKIGNVRALFEYEINIKSDLPNMQIGFCSCFVVGDELTQVPISSSCVCKQSRSNTDNKKKLLSLISHVYIRPR